VTGAVPTPAVVQPGDGAGPLPEVLDLTQRLIRTDTSNLPGNETPAAQCLLDFLAGSGVDADLVARDPDRANLVARIPGSGSGPSVAFVGHLDVVPADARDWTHPPFEAVVDDEGYLYGRGAVDMKNEVAARTVAFARLARSGFRPSGDLWLVMVSDEEDGRARTGMEWLVEAMPEIRPDLAINEGGSGRLVLPDGRALHAVSIGEKGTYPARVTAIGEAGHASMPTLGRNAVLLLARLLAGFGDGLPDPGLPEVSRPFFAALLGEAALAEPGADPAELVERARAAHPVLRHVVPALTGTTMTPTMLAAGVRLNVIPARAAVDFDCRVLPGTEAAEVQADLLARLGDELPYQVEWVDRFIAGTASRTDGALPSAIQSWLDQADPGSAVLPTICPGFTDSTHLRNAFGTAAYGFSPFLRTPADVIEAGFHNADERVHVDDLADSVRFHEYLARTLLA
jgi:acetylornithine deacetylase/succinyl-diaminopimelate desuccinylase-like protein